MSADLKITEVDIGEVYVTIKYSDGSTMKASTQEVADVYFSTSHRPTTLFPPVMRYISSDMKGFLLERPPTIVNVSIADPKEEKGASFAVPLPWQIVAIQLTGDSCQTHLYFRGAQMYSQRDSFLLAAHPGLHMASNTMPAVFDPTANMNKFLDDLYAGSPVVIGDDYDVEAFMDRLPERFQLKDLDGKPYDIMCQLLSNWASASDVTEDDWKVATDGDVEICGAYWIDLFIKDMAVGSSTSSIDKTNIFTFFESLVSSAAGASKEQKKAKAGHGL